MTEQHIRVATCNFELNGKGDPEIWKHMHTRLADLSLDVLCRQELVGCAAQGRASQLWHASETALGMIGTLGPHVGATAVYLNPQTFEVVETWDTASWHAWWLHPTALTARLRGTHNTDFVVGSAHLDFDSPTARATQAENLTRLADRPGAGNRTGGKMPVLALCGDWNSYPSPHLAPGEPSLPMPQEILDPQHLAHRSFIDGEERVMDFRPDQILHGAGMTDTARHIAHTHKKPSAVHPTTDETRKPQQGPARRIDRIYTSNLLLPALVDVEVIPMTDLSDHHTVIASYCRKTLMDLSHSQLSPAA